MLGCFHCKCVKIAIKILFLTIYFFKFYFFSVDLNFYSYVIFLKNMLNGSEKIKSTKTLFFISIEYEVFRTSTVFISFKRLQGGRHQSRSGLNL